MSLGAQNRWSWQTHLCPGLTGKGADLIASVGGGLPSTQESWAPEKCTFLCLWHFPTLELHHPGLSWVEGGVVLQPEGIRGSRWHIWQTVLLGFPLHSQARGPLSPRSVWEHPPSGPTLYSSQRYCSFIPPPLASSLPLHSLMTPSQVAMPLPCDGSSSELPPSSLRAHCQPRDRACAGCLTRAPASSAGSLLLMQAPVLDSLPTSVLAFASSRLHTGSHGFQGVAMDVYE